MPLHLALAEAMIFCSLGLWVYWISRLWLVLRGSRQKVDQTLDADLRWGRRLWLTLKSAFTQSADSLTI